MRLFRRRRRLSSAGSVTPSERAMVERLAREIRRAIRADQERNGVPPSQRLR